MHRARSNQWSKCAGWGAAVAMLFLVAWSTAALAQEPPLNVPKGGRPSKGTDTIAVGEWLVYPQVRGFALWSDNLFQSPTNPIRTSGYGVFPSLVTERSDGIHTTTLYGNLERRIYPQHDELDTFDRNAGFTQRFEAMRDLNFRFQGDYKHNTNASPLI